MHLGKLRRSTSPADGTVGAEHRFPPDGWRFFRQGSDALLSIGRSGIGTEIASASFDMLGLWRFDLLVKPSLPMRSA